MFSFSPKLLNLDIVQNNISNNIFIGARLFFEIQIIEILDDRNYRFTAYLDHSSVRIFLQIFGNILITMFVGIF